MEGKCLKTTVKNLKRLERVGCRTFLIRIKMSRCLGAKLSAFNSLNILLKSKSLTHTLKCKQRMRVPIFAGDFFLI